MAINCLNILLIGHFKSHFIHMKNLPITGKYFTNIYVYYIKGIWIHWYNQVLWGMKYIFKDIYGVLKYILGG